MDHTNSLHPTYFDKVYAANEDPWNFETSAYEAEKYASTLDALPKDKYKNVLEIGCSIGVFTKMLAQKCEKLLATDVSEVALRKARERCANFENITFKRLSFPDEISGDQYDLIMISEVAYYLSSADWSKAMYTLYGKLAAEGQIVLVHWLPEVHDYPQTGDQVHDLFEKTMVKKMKNVLNSRAEKYRIDVWEKI